MNPAVIAVVVVLDEPGWRDPWSVPAPRHGPAPQVREGLRRAGAVPADAGYVVDEIEPLSIDAAGRMALRRTTARWANAQGPDQGGTIASR